MLHLQKWSAPSLPITLALAKEIRMEVVFGTPSQNCVGSGVCMIMNRLPRHKNLWCPHAPAWISYEEGRVRFRFVKSEVMREDAVTRLDSRFFLIRETVQMPRKLTTQFGLSSPWVKPGLYPMEENSREWILEVCLWEELLQVREQKSNAISGHRSFSAVRDLLQEE